MHKHFASVLAFVILLTAVSCGSSTPEPGTVNDTTAPEIAVQNIVDGQAYGLLEQGDNTVLVRGIATDQGGVAGMEIRLDGQLVASSNGTQVEYSWDAEQYSEGQHSFSVLATDNSGNSSDLSISVIVNNSKPALPGDVFGKDDLEKKLDPNPGPGAEDPGDLGGPKDDPLPPVPPPPGMDPFPV